MRKTVLAAFLCVLFLLVFAPANRTMKASIYGTAVFYADGGLVEGGSTVSRTAFIGESYELPEDPVLAGAVFQGWYTGKNGTGDRLETPQMTSIHDAYYAYYTLNYSITKVWRASQPQYMPPAGQNEFAVGLQLLKYYTQERSYVQEAAPLITLDKGVYTYTWTGLNRYFDDANTILAKFTVREVIQPDAYNQSLYSLHWWYDETNHVMVNSWLPVILNGNHSYPCELIWNAQAFIDPDTPDYSNNNFPYKVNCNAYGDPVSGYFVVHHWMSNSGTTQQLYWRIPIATDAEIYNGELRVQLPPGTNWVLDYEKRPDGTWPVGFVSPQWRFDLISSLPNESYTLLDTGYEVLTFDADTLVIRFPYMPAKSAYMLSFSGKPLVPYQQGDHYILSADFTADYRCLKAVKKWIGEPAEGTEVIFELLRDGKSLADTADLMFQGMLGQRMDRSQLTAWINSKAGDFPMIWAVLRDKTFHSYWQENTEYVFTQAEIDRLSLDLRALYTQLVVYPQTEAAWTGLTWGADFSAREIYMTEGAVPRGEPAYSVDGTITGMVNGAPEQLIHKTSYTFTNAAPPTPVVRVPVVVNKELTGRPLKAGEFSFSLYDAQGGLIQTVQNDAKGRAAFLDRTFSKAGTFVYTVRETKGKAENISYDGTVYHAIIKVAEADGRLNAALSLTKDGVPFAGPLAFHNAFRMPETGDSRVVTTLLLAAAALILLLAAFAIHRRRAGK